MERSPPTGLVVTRDGFQGVIDSPSRPSAEPDEVPVQFGGGERLSIPIKFLSLQEDGRYVLPLALAEARMRWPGKPVGEAPVVIPVVAETVVWHPQTVETGRVRIAKHVTTRTEEVDEPLVEETVEIERIPVDRPVEGPLPARYEGDTLIVPILEERLVVEKRLVLKEELRITKRRTETRRPRPVSLRREEVTIERIPSGEREAAAEPTGGSDAH
jgi:uncharacterized protein (TIGR02271 family)